MSGFIKRTGAAVAVALGAMTLASPASAAANCTSLVTPSGCYINYVENTSGTFGNVDPQTYPPHFEDTFNFTTAYARNVTIQVDSSHYDSDITHNVNFMFNGVKIDGKVLATTSTGVTEQRYLANFRIPAGANIISVIGASQPNGEYSGFFTLSGVPETSTWAMMVLGVGFVGSAMRTRRRQSVRVAHA